MPAEGFPSCKDVKGVLPVCPGCQGRLWSLKHEVEGIVCELRLEFLCGAILGEMDYAGRQTWVVEKGCAEEFEAKHFRKGGNGQ
jgi:hypothetical protein